MKNQVKRSTKKFIVNGRLTGALKKRKFLQKKYRQESEKVPKERPAVFGEADVPSERPLKRPRFDGNEDSTSSQSNSATSAKERGEEERSGVEEMDVEEFMQSGLFGSDQEEEGDDDWGDEDDEGKVEEEVPVRRNRTSVNDVSRSGRQDEGEEETRGEDDESLIAADAKAMEAELKALQEKDPDFYAQLQADDPGLLNFSADPFREDVKEEEEEEEEEDGVQAHNKRKKLKKSKVQVAQEITLKRWKKIRAAVLAMKSSTALKTSVHLFRLAVHSGDSEEHNVAESAVNMLNSRVHESVIRFAVSDLPAVFCKHLSISPQLHDHCSIAENPQFPQMAAPLKSYLVNFVHLFQSMQDVQMNRLLIQTILNYLTPLFDEHPKLVLKLMKRLLELWATSDHSTRIDSFLCLRHLSVSLNAKHGLLEEALKGIYLAYVKHARFTTASTVPVLEFMCNCIVELYSIDPVLAYQHAFVYIRQLAIHMRNAISQHSATVKKSSTSSTQSNKSNSRFLMKSRLTGSSEQGYKTVYNWQFINCLRVWTRVLSSPLASQPILTDKALDHGESSALRPLLYPFVQISLAELNLMPSARYHPLRVHVVAFLLSLAKASHVYIPVLPHLLRIFHSVELTKKPIASSKKVPELTCALKVSKNTVITRAYQEQLCLMALDSIMAFASVHSYSVAFPELIFPARRNLKRFAKTTNITRLCKQMNSLLTKLDHNCQWIVSQRSTSTYTPQDALTGKLDPMFTFKPSTGEETNERLWSPIERYLKYDSSTKLNISQDVDWLGRSVDKSNRHNRDSDGEEEDENDLADEELILQSDSEQEYNADSSRSASSSRRNVHKQLNNKKRTAVKAVDSESLENSRDHNGVVNEPDVVTDLYLSDED